MAPPSRPPAEWGATLTAGARGVLRDYGALRRDILAEAAVGGAEREELLAHRSNTENLGEKEKQSV